MSTERSGGVAKANNAGAGSTRCAMQPVGHDQAGRRRHRFPGSTPVPLSSTTPLESYSATSPRLIFIASSTRSRLCPESLPSLFWSRSRSTDRIWLTITAERLGKPLSSGSISTSLGNGGSENWELMAATMVIGLCWLEMSFWMTTAGRVFWISCPTVGSKPTR